MGEQPWEGDDEQDVESMDVTKQLRNIRPQGEAQSLLFLDIGSMP